MLGKGLGTSYLPVAIVEYSAEEQLREEQVCFVFQFFTVPER